MAKNKEKCGQKRLLEISRYEVNKRKNMEVITV
jgi:hypothetical protein